MKTKLTIIFFTICTYCFSQIPEGYKKILCVNKKINNIYIDTIADLILINDNSFDYWHLVNINEKRTSEIYLPHFRKLKCFDANSITYRLYRKEKTYKYDINTKKQKKIRTDVPYNDTYVLIRNVSEIYACNVKCTEQEMNIISKLKIYKTRPFSYKRINRTFPLNEDTKGSEDSCWVFYKFGDRGYKLNFRISWTYKNCWYGFIKPSFTGLTIYKFNKEFQEYELAKQNYSNCIKYLQNFPNSKFYDEILNLAIEKSKTFKELSNLKNEFNCNLNKVDEKALSIAINGNYLDCIQYIGEYPNSKYKEQVEELLIKRANNFKMLDTISGKLNYLQSKVENRAYQIAKAGNYEDCLRYLEKYPKSKFENEISELAISKSSNFLELSTITDKYNNLQNLAEERAFEIVKNGDYHYCSKYLRNYPEGKHKEDVIELIIKKSNTIKMLKSIADDFEFLGKNADSKAYKIATTNYKEYYSVNGYKEYLSLFPTGIYSSVVNAFMEKRSNNTKKYSNPIICSKTTKFATIEKIEIFDYTYITFKISSKKNGYKFWFDAANSSSAFYIYDTQSKIRYKLLGGTNLPTKENPQILNYNDSKQYILKFQKIPSGCKIFNLIEGEDGLWNFYGISLYNLSEFKNLNITYKFREQWQRRIFAGINDVFYYDVYCDDYILFSIITEYRNMSAGVPDQISVTYLSHNLKEYGEKETFRYHKTPNNANNAHLTRYKGEENDADYVFSNTSISGNIEAVKYMTRYCIYKTLKRFGYQFK